MARINETVITIKVSELLKDDDPSEELLDEKIVEQVIIELVGPDKLVEVTRT